MGRNLRGVCVSGCVWVWGDRGAEASLTCLYCAHHGRLWVSVVQLYVLCGGACAYVSWFCLWQRGVPPLSAQITHVHGEAAGLPRPACAPAAWPTVYYSAAGTAVAGHLTKVWVVVWRRVTSRVLPVTS
jgi:hypothetical protein